MRNLSQARITLTAQLRQTGWIVAKDAMEPLAQIDFAKLVLVHDHEEHFLEQLFLQSLIVLRNARVSTASDRGKVTAADVKTALLMLGAAAKGQSDATLSPETRRSIVSSCGFC